MIINHNLTAMNANRQLNIVTGRQAKHMEKLSSGYKINRAADDAAGLAISEKMRRLIRGLNKGIENAQDGVSLCQIADGALNEVQDILQRMNELAIKAANGTMSIEDRQAIQNEIDQLISEIDRVSETTKFNEMDLFEYSHKSLSGVKLSDTAPTLYNADGEVITDADLAGYTSVNDAAAAFYTAKRGKDGVTFYVGGASEITGYFGDYIDSTNYTVKYKAGMMLYDAQCNEIAESTLNTYFYGDNGKLMIRPVSGLTIYRGKEGDTNSPASASHFVATGHSSDSKRWWIQCGSESGVGMFIEIESIDTVTLGIHGMDVTTQEGADRAISMISGALEKVSSIRSNIGAQQNRLEHTIANESNIVENTTAAESQIRDADIAKEMLGLSTANILAQAGISVLAQANTTNEEVLMLLR